MARSIFIRMKNVTKMYDHCEWVGERRGRQVVVLVLLLGPLIFRDVAWGDTLRHQSG